MCEEQRKRRGEESCFLRSEKREEEEAEKRGVCFRWSPDCNYPDEEREKRRVSKNVLPEPLPVVPHRLLLVLMMGMTAHSARALKRETIKTTSRKTDEHLSEVGLFFSLSLSPGLNYS